MIFRAPIPGQAWQHAPRTMPWDRPPQFADVNKALIFMFKRFRQPSVTKQILNLIDAEVPVDFIVRQMLMTAFRNGTIGASCLIPMVGPLFVMIIRMAESAGLHPITGDQKAAQKQGKQFDPTDLMAAQARFGNNPTDKATDANSKSVKDLTQKNVNEKQGFAKFVPVAKKNGMVF